MNERQRLIELVKKVSFQYREDPPFTLASGHTSPYYFNMKKTTMSAEGLHLTGKVIYDRLKAENLQIKGIGGLTLGADPISYAVSLHAHTQGETLHAFVVRKEPKGHGLKLPIEGLVSPGDPVVIVDDVITTGSSTIKAIQAAQDFGLNIKAVVVLVDRCEYEGRQNIAAFGYPVYDILTINDFIPTDKARPRT